jgi:thiamine phosphate synthase YjbQ (UPF0047 family)
MSTRRSQAVSSNKQEVTVFSFHTLESGFESSAVSTFKATREAIVQVHGGDVIEGTGQRVSVDELDTQGRYRRVATGWGELS